MAFVYVNRAKMTVPTSGTGVITLGSAMNKYQSFADAGVTNGDTFRYLIEDGADWEIGTGTYTSVGTTVARSVEESSNSDAALNLSGSARIMVIAAADDVGRDTAAEILVKLLTVDGAGSGLDADLLDGLSSAAFATAAHTHIVADLSDASADAKSLLQASTYAGMRMLLGLVAGVDFYSVAAADAAFAAINHVHAASDITSGVLAYERGGLEEDISAFNGLLKVSAGSTSTVTDNSVNWDAAFGWGNHAAAGYATISGVAAAYQPLDADLTAIAALTSAANKVPYSTGAGTWALADFTAAGRALLDDADATTQLSTLGLSANGKSLVTAADYAAMRALLDLEAGTDFYSVSAANAAFQPLDSDLTSIAALTTAAAGRSVLELVDPNADRIAFWDDSAGAMAWLTLGTNLSITGTTINATGGGGGGGTPGGADTQIQFNDGGSFGGDAGFTFDKTTNRIVLGDAYTGLNRTGPAQISSVHTAAAPSGNNENAFAGAFQSILPDASGAFTNHTAIGVTAEARIPSTRTNTGTLPGSIALHAYAINESDFDASVLSGVDGGVVHAGTGQVSNAYGLSYYIVAADNGFGAPGDIAAANVIDVFVYSESDITDLKFLNVQPPDVATGKTVTNAYGAYIPNMSYGGSGTITNGWNIYSLGATSRNYFQGKVGIGTATPTVALDVVGDTKLTGQIDQVLTVTNPSNFYGHGISYNVTQNASGGVNRNALYVIAIMDGSGNNPSVTGGIFVSSYAGSGAITNVTGIYGEGFIDSGSVSNVFGMDFYAYTELSGTATNAYGIRAGWAAYDTSTLTNGYGAAILRPYVASGRTVTNSYGLWIGDHTANNGTGTITNGWNIYSLGATSRNYFQGKVGIGTAAPSVALDVVGNELLTGKKTINYTSTINANDSALRVDFTRSVPSSSSSAYGVHITARTPASNGGTSVQTVLGVYSGVDVPNTIASNWGLVEGGDFFISNASTYNVTRATGLAGVADHYGTGTVGELSGLSFVVEAYNNGYGTPGLVTNAKVVTVIGYFESAVTNFYGVEVQPLALGSGSVVTNAYGLYVGDHTVPSAGTITNGWNIYSLGATSRNYFQGKVGIGTAAPSVALDVVGDTLLTGQARIGTLTPLNPYVPDTMTALRVSKTGATPAANGNKTAAASFDHVAPTSNNGKTFVTVEGIQASAVIPNTMTTAWAFAVGAEINAINYSPQNVDWQLVGVQGSAEHQGTGTLNELIGLYYSINAYGTGVGDVTTARGIWVNNYFDDSIQVTNLYSIRLEPAYAGTSSVITNAYGIYIGNHVVPSGGGTITNGWNIYSDGATSRNYFAGFMGVGTAVLTTAQLALAAGTTAKASLNIASGVAPTSAINGDIWFDGTDIKMQIGGSAVALNGGAGGISDGDKGDITVSGSGTTWTIDASTITLAKMADVATASVFYRKTGGTGAPEVQTLATLKTDLGLTGTNSGDQTSIVGITGTKAQFDTAVTDGNILYVGDITQYTDELAQDAIGAMLDASLTYVDATPLLQRAALTGAITASAGSNATSLGSFTKAQLDAAVSDGNVLYVGDVVGLTDGDKGDITVSSSGTVWTIDNDVVTYAKMQNVSATSRILGRITAAAGDVEELTGANVRTITGLATTDSPQFTALEIGNASDTTLARISAGDLTVEGNILYRAGGTDVPVTDGGTGASTVPTAQANLKMHGLTIGLKEAAYY